MSTGWSRSSLRRQALLLLGDRGQGSVSLRGLSERITIIIIIILYYGYYLHGKMADCVMGCIHALCMYYLQFSLFHRNINIFLSFQLCSFTYFYLQLCFILYFNFFIVNRPYMHYACTIYNSPSSTEILVFFYLSNFVSFSTSTYNFVSFSTSTSSLSTDDKYWQPFII